MRGTKLYGIVAAAFMAGAFLASPELRVYASTIANDVICSGCVGTSDLAGNAVTAAKIKDSEVKAAEIATDAVGASELQGVTKLLFGHCTLTSGEKSTNVAAGSNFMINCTINGVDSDDSAIATLVDPESGCFVVRNTWTESNLVRVNLGNACPVTTHVGGSGAHIGIIVFDK